MSHLLAISYRFPPETYPLAIRVDYFLSHLARTHTVHALTAASEPVLPGVSVRTIQGGDATRLKNGMQRLRLKKMADWMFWPDPFIGWIVPALYAAYREVKRKRPDAILAFAMPYTSAIVGALLKKMTGVPLILNFNDSLTCPDVNATYPSRMHARAAKRLEDWLVQTADASVFVSQENLDRVRQRQPESHRNTLHLIRRGVRPVAMPVSAPVSKEATAAIRIVYTGGLSGWHMHQTSNTERGLIARTARTWWHRWNHWGQYRASPIDPSTHTPVYIGQAVQHLRKAHPEWTRPVEVHVYGNTFPTEVVNAVLQRYDLHDVVTVHPPQPHDTALRLMHEADVLFLTLPDRPDGTPGGRISAKTYEYLMTDQPIVAAVPPGENRNYLQDKPGVVISAPADVEALTRALTPWIAALQAGQPLAIDRTHLHNALHSTTRATAYAALVDHVCTSPAAVFSAPHLTPA